MACSSPCSQQQWPAEDKPDEEPDRSKQELKKNKNKNFLKSRGDWERKPLGSKQETGKKWVPETAMVCYREASL